MEVKEDLDFGDLQDRCWGQAVDILKEISDADKEDALMNYLENVFSGDIPTMTEVNDLLAYDWEQVYKDIGMVQWDELKDLLNDKAIKKAKDVIQEIEDKWEEFKDSDENKDEKEAVAKILKENMEQAADLLVPLDVDVHEGASWFEAK